MSKETPVEPISLAEGKAAIQFCRTYGGREAIVEYLAPLREFVKYFGTLDRFDYVLQEASVAFGVEMEAASKQEAETVTVLPSVPVVKQKSAGADIAISINPMEKVA